MRLAMASLALGFLVYLQCAGRLGFAHRGHPTDALLAGLGVVTAVPLLLFGAGARRLRLATIGFLQYLAPTMTFLLAVLVFGEPLGFARALTFILIWAGIVVYAADSLRSIA